MYFLPLSNQSKEAFIDWARYDDSQDHFCELDGKMFKLFQSVCFICCLLKNTKDYSYSANNNFEKVLILCCMGM